MKTLPPAAQRFYEIISRKIFAALKNDYSRAKISYSEYCTFSAQLRHFERQRVQDQMAKVLRPHKASGYITDMKYEPIIGAQNEPDWILYFTPGPKARAEFAAAHVRRKTLKPIDIAATEAGDHQSTPSRSETRKRQMQIEPVAAQPTFDPELIAEFTRRGITNKKARELLGNLKPGQDVIAQLEHIDYMVQHARFPITNPPGFYIRLIESNTSIPDGFETTAKRKAREEKEEKERKHRAAEDARRLLESDYDDYCSVETDRYIEENAAAFESMKNIKRAENRERYTALSPDLIESMAAFAARSELQKQVALLTFEEFVDRKQQGTDYSLKQVAPSLAEGSATAEHEAEQVPPPSETANGQSDSRADADVSLGEISVPQRDSLAPAARPEDLLAADELREAATNQTLRDTEAIVDAGNVTRPKPVLPEPMMLELVSNPALDEPSGSAPQQETA
jgi:hypothetical protein